MLFLLIVVVTAAGGLMQPDENEFRRRYTHYEQLACSFCACCVTRFALLFRAASLSCHWFDCGVDRVTC